MRGVFSEIDDLLGGDIQPEGKTTRVIEEGKSPEMVQAIKALGSAWLRTHIKGLSEQEITEAMDMASVQETYDSENPNDNGMVSPRGLANSKRCEYRLITTIEQDGERTPFNLYLNPSLGGY